MGGAQSSQLGMSVRGSRGTPSVYSASSSTLSSQAVANVQVDDPGLQSDTDQESDTRIFALVITIDKYRNNSIKNLNGCVRDGDDFVNFLTNRDTLHVPSHHIWRLSNEEATRGRIIDEFKQRLIKNDTIRRNDTILFFYAGHGDREDAPKDWRAPDNQIEVIVPHDANTVNEEGKIIHNIPDRSFDALMRRLAQKKGNNILAILDSCHSGGMARDAAPVELGCSPRSLGEDVTRFPIPETLDDDLLTDDEDAVGDRAAKQVVPKGFRYPATASHVLMAACRGTEKAIENRVPIQDDDGTSRSIPRVATVTRGRFTLHLLASLRWAYSNKVHHQLTYARLINRVLSEEAMALCPVTLSGQHPLCEGKHRDRLLFSRSEMAGEEESFTLHYGPQQTLYVHAGRIHGAVRGTEFILSAPEGVLPPAGHRVVAEHVEELRCTVTSPNISNLRDIVENVRAVTYAWDLTPMKVGFDSDMALSMPRPGQLACIKVNPRDYCDVSLATEKNHWILTRFDPLTSQFAEPKLTISDLALQLNDILERVARYNVNLYRFNNPQSDSQTLRPRVVLRRLQETGPGGLLPLLLPFGDDLFGDSAIQVPCHPDSTYKIHGPVKEAEIYDMSPYYGLTLFNDSEFDLYPYVFYFDPATYAVEAWYLPQGSNMPAPLPKKECGSTTPGELMIGYGAGGADSIRFSLPASTKRDTGFLKVFVSTSYVDMRSLEQNGVTDQEHRGPTMERLPIRSTWAASVHVLTCCAKPADRGEDHTDIADVGN